MIDVVNISVAHCCIVSSVVSDLDRGERQIDYCETWRPLHSGSENVTFFENYSV